MIRNINKDKYDVFWGTGNEFKTVGCFDCLFFGLREL